VRGRIRLGRQRRTNPVAIGDTVSLQLNKDGTGVIIQIHERTNALTRRAAGRRAGRRQILVSNVERVWIVQSAAFPKPNTGLIDRILVATEAQELASGIILNKMDLAAGQLVDNAHAIRRLYSQLGYPVLLTSAVVGENMDAVKKNLTGRVSVFTGPSGVGKTTLLNTIEPALNLRTRPVSTRTRKGRHTTAHSELFSLSGGGGVIDTPGIREFGVLDVKPWELAHYFREFRRHLDYCRYTACTHDHEPGCRIKEARKTKSITETRYRSYLNILRSLQMGTADVGR